MMTRHETVRLTTPQVLLSVANTSRARDLPPSDCASSLGFYVTDIATTDDVRHQPAGTRRDLSSSYVGDDAQRALARRQLEGLIAYPREGLDVELKGWLDLDDGEHQADLAKAILAIANSGGGHVLIGFVEDGGTWAPDAGNRPGNLDAYSQDRLNGIISNYAEPSFHCELHHVPEPENGDAFPVIVVPGGHRVPIRSRRDGPNQRHVRINTYYIRRLGPASEPPQTGREWDELIGRCVRAAREQLLEDVRTILEGQPRAREAETEGEEPARARLEAWVAESRVRWERVVEQRGAQDRYAHGFYTFAYLLEGNLEKPNQAQLLQILERAQGRETGWPAWLVIRERGDDGVRPVDGLVESILLDGVFADPSHSDYWLAAPDARLFLVRGYAEDDEPARLEPGSALDLTLPVWRTGEALLHAERLARELNDEAATVHFRASWEGLEGRTLRALYSRRLLTRARPAAQNVVTATASVAANQIGATLPEVVATLLEPLYGVFDFFEVPLRVVEEELDEMRRGR